MNYNTKTKKKINNKIVIILIFIFLSIFLIISFLLYYFNPRLKYKYDAASDSYKITKVYGYAKSYTIPSTHKGKKVTIIDKRCFENKDIDEVIFEKNSNIITIETRAFYNCSVRYIELPSSVEFVYEGAFAYSNIESFSTSNDSKLKDLAGSTFFNCQYLKEVEIKNLESIGTLAFYNCKKLESINLYNETKIFPRAFVNCDILINAYQNNTYDNGFDTEAHVTITNIKEV